VCFSYAFHYLKYFLVDDKCAIAIAVPFYFLIFSEAKNYCDESIFTEPFEKILYFIFRGTKVFAENRMLVYLQP